MFVGQDWLIEGSQYLQGTRLIKDNQRAIRAMSYTLFKRFRWSTPEQRAKQIEAAFQQQCIGVSEGLRASILDCTSWTPPRRKRKRPEPVQRTQEQIDESEERQQSGNVRVADQNQNKLRAIAEQYFSEHGTHPTVYKLYKLTGMAYKTVIRILKFFKQALNIRLFNPSNDSLVNQYISKSNNKHDLKHDQDHREINGNTSVPVDGLNSFEKFIRLYQELGIAKHYQDSNNESKKSIACKYCNESIWFKDLGFKTWVVRETNTGRVHNCTKLHLIKPERPKPQIETPQMESLIEKINRMIFKR